MNQPRITLTALALAAASTAIPAIAADKFPLAVTDQTALPHCPAPLATISIVENLAPDPTDQLPEGLRALARMAEAQDGKGPSRVDPVPLVRLMATTSGCFRVAERGTAFDAVQRERQMAGMTTNQGLASADYVAQVMLMYSDEKTRAQGAAGGSFGSAIGLKSKTLQSQIMITLIDVRTGIQEVVTTGSAHKKDISIIGGGLLLDLGVGALGGAYSGTDIGQITALATLDAFRKFIPAAQARIPATIARAPEAPTPAPTK